MERSRLRFRWDLDSESLSGLLLQVLDLQFQFEFLFYEIRFTKRITLIKAQQNCHCLVKYRAGVAVRTSEI